MANNCWEKGFLIESDADAKKEEQNMFFGANSNDCRKSEAKEEIFFHSACLNLCLNLSLT